MNESNLITSRLWKAGLLARDSLYFPRLVEAAAWLDGKDYTDHMLRWVAATPTILDALELPVGEGMDSVLAQFVVTHGDDVDEAINAAVNAYQPPPEPPAPPEPQA